MDVCICDVLRSMSIERSLSIYVYIYIHASFHYSAVISRREVSNISVILNNLENSHLILFRYRKFAETFSYFLNLPNRGF